ncbi:MAG: dihydrofolate reductase [Acidobacteria bacterium]|nr:dihydrofolate reductase [Acidobacteriota bacterium]MBV9474510.1 dihydrofolate reductase [Acidobacteriota bacterium]
MRAAIIAALTTNNVIGRDNGLPWHLGTDLRRLKSLTLGHHFIMGRKTYESVGKPLPGRTNVVITTRADYAPEGVTVVHSLEDALRLAADARDPEPFIAGGGEIFRLAIHRAQRMYLTRIHAEIEGDAFFPDFDDVNEWHLVDAEHFEADEKNDYPFSFLTYDRAGAAGHAIPEEG